MLRPMIHAAIERRVAMLTEVIDSMGTLTVDEEQHLGGALIGVGLAHLRHSGADLETVIATINRLWTDPQYVK